MDTVRVALALAVTLTFGRAAAAQRSDAADVRSSPLPSGMGDQKVSCYDGPALIDDADERRALRGAPEGASRASAHVLVVNTGSGPRRFEDERPEAVELDRFHWSYCGYVAALHAHLIGMEDGSLFSGKLLLDHSGRMLEAGATVYPSPDGKLFLAASQDDGDALEQWVISDLSGHRLWAGESGITKIENKIQVVGLEFEAPRWVSDDALSVTATCGDRVGTKGRATLVREGAFWRWKTDLRCQN